MRTLVLLAALLAPLRGGCWNFRSGAGLCFGLELPVLTDRLADDCDLREPARYPGCRGIGLRLVIPFGKSRLRVALPDDFKNGA